MTNHILLVVVLPLLSLSMFPRWRHLPKPLRQAIYWSPMAITLAQLMSVERISGRSMQVLCLLIWPRFYRCSRQPTLNPDSSGRKDVAVFDRISMHFWRPCQRGDIVAIRCVRTGLYATATILFLDARSPSDPTRMLVKRIIAIEGDVVKTRPPCLEPKVSVPTGHIWIEGLWPKLRYRRALINVPKATDRKSVV